VVLDSACQLWEVKCNHSQGSCWIYNRDMLSTRLFSWWLVVKVKSNHNTFIIPFPLNAVRIEHELSWIPAPYKTAVIIIIIMVTLTLCITPYSRITHLMMMLTMMTMIMMTIDDDDD
jgi:hypothetical protein